MNSHSAPMLSLWCTQRRVRERKESERESSSLNTTAETMFIFRWLKGVLHSDPPPHQFPCVWGSVLNMEVPKTAEKWEQAYVVMFLEVQRNNKRLLHCLKILKRVWEMKDLLNTLNKLMSQNLQAYSRDLVSGSCFCNSGIYLKKKKKLPEFKSSDSHLENTI